jgi:choline-sulfatase
MSVKKETNVVYIISDQHNKHMLGCYGNDMVKTPNLDRLAEEGMRFENAYCNSPVCVPSRSSMVTGKYIHDGGFWDNAQAYGGECPSFATRLYEQGYPVTAIGKMHLESDTPMTGFKDQRIPLHMVNGEGDVYGCIRNKTITRPQFRKTLDSAGAGENDYTRYDRAIAKYAASYLKEETKDLQKPFVLYVGFVSPHFPLTVPQKYLDMYEDVNLMELVQSKSTEWPSHPVLDDYRRYCNMEEVSPQIAKNALKTYCAMCSFLDEQVGVVLDAIKDAGLESSTRIIYTSDHGDTMGEHGLFYKSTMYEGSVGIPLLISGPDIPAKAVNKAPCSLIDIFPTLLECVGARPSVEDSSLPGISLLSLDSEANYERPIFSEYHNFGIYTGEFMIRVGDYKYVYYVQERPQLFNLKHDCNELHDLAMDETYQSIIEKMDIALRCIVDPEEVDRQAKKSQEKILAKYGGEQEFLQCYKPLLFSPIPKNL